MMAEHSPLLFSRYATGVVLTMVVVTICGLLLASRIQPPPPANTHSITVYFPSKSASDPSGCPRLVPQQINVTGEIPNTTSDRVHWVIDLLKDGPSAGSEGQKLYTAVPQFITVRSITDLTQTLVVDFDASANQVHETNCEREVLGNQISQTLNQFAETPQRIQFTVVGEYESLFERPLPFIP